ncbi:MAG: DNA-formamidopyrimidine glycosylase family protein [Actinomycetota bacterium]|nr:DNA-formamidopyrimidine glycosylase family protein [Actinomycetota bacterium]
MPEILEVESYRTLAELVVGRTIAEVKAPDPWYVKGGATPGDIDDAMSGRRVTSVRRRGKLLLLDSGGPTLGLRFGMTGRLLVDGKTSIDYLRWGARRTDPAWERFGLVFRGGGRLWVDDPRRLGGVELAPEEEDLGPDAWSVTVSVLATALAGGRGPLKARLLDQSRLAGLGNLLTDEVLWRAGLSPHRPAGSLDREEQLILGRTIRSTIALLYRRGGSHTGDLMPVRTNGGCCPVDGHPLERDVVGGRTTWWCPAHQR